MKRIDIVMKDVFISWTGKDVEIKTEIADLFGCHLVTPFCGL